MAATFNGLVIGGQDGKPFPNYSISSESLMSDDEVILNTKFTIQITGKIIALGDMEIDAIYGYPYRDIPFYEGEDNVGVRQNNLHGQINEFLNLARGGTEIGRLEIDPYGGLPNKLEFLSSKLISINIPEQDDESSGVLFSNYEFTFECIENTHNQYSVSSAQENWELNVEDSTTYSPNAEGAIYKIYTIAHSVSAKGIRKYIEDSLSPVGDAYKQAQLFVNSRLVNSPSSVSGSLFGQASANYNPVEIELGPNLTTDSYGYYNHVRIPSCDIGGGSYSITDTWTSSREPYILEMENTQDISDTGISSVTLSGTIVGLSTDPVTSSIINRIENAEVALNHINSKAYDIAKLSFVSNSCTGELLNYTFAKSIGRNRGTGTITFSYTFNNNRYPPSLVVNNVPMVTSYSLSVSDENEDGLNNVIAIIPIILKANGPEIQDMGTTGEKRRSVQLDMVMDLCHRSAKPYSIIQGIIESKKPTFPNVFRESKVENWDDITGNYSITIAWIY